MGLGRGVRPRRSHHDARRHRRRGGRRPRLRPLAYRRWRMSTAGPATGEARSPSGGGAVTAPTTSTSRTGTRASVAFAGFLLSSLAVVTILLVGLPALVLPSC